MTTKRRKPVLILILASLFTAGWLSRVEAQATPPAKLVLLGPQQQLIAGLYEGTGPNASTAVLVFHDTANFISAPPCVQLFQRGFTALCTDAPFPSTGQVVWDQVALNIGYGVSYLRSLPSIQHVVLVGHSGGGAAMAWYQNVAENGLAACQASARLNPCGNNLAGLPPADGVVLLDAIPGLAFTTLSALDASVVETDGLTSQQNPSLYLFNSANGYNTDPNQSSTYSRAIYKELEPYCGAVVQERVVDEGDIITSGGSSSAIDTGLHLVQRLAGADARARIATQMDYPYQWNRNPRAI